MKPIELLKQYLSSIKAEIAGYKARIRLYPNPALNAEWNKKIEILEIEKKEYEQTLKKFNSF